MNEILVSSNALSYQFKFELPKIYTFWDILHDWKTDLIMIG